MSPAEKLRTWGSLIAFLSVPAAIAVGVTQSVDLGDGDEFNWTLSLLAFAPLFIAGIMLVCAASIVAVLRR
jgi:hypothetical protein